MMILLRVYVGRVTAVISRAKELKAAARASKALTTEELSMEYPGMR